MAAFDHRTPPHNLEAEQAVLGGILLDNQNFHRVADIVHAEDFYRPAYAKIYAAMTELASHSEPIDTVTLPQRMIQMGVLEEVGGIGTLAELLERTPTATNSEYHARIVADLALKRNLITSCSDISSKGYEPGETTDELLDYAERTVFALATSRRSQNMLPVREIVKGAFQELERRFENQNEMTGIPSGWLELDKLTQGFQRSDLVIVACRPSMGKTSFSLGAARHAAVLAKTPVLFFSLEMSKEQIVTRLLAAEAKVDQTRIRTGRLTEQDWARLTRAAGLLSDAKLFVDDTPSLTAMELRSKARRLHSEVGGLGLIVVDYLQIMGTPPKDSRERAISDISRALKALAKELNVPVIALSQLNRDIEKRNDRRPIMADLRESGAIEQDADIIIFIHRDDIEAQAMSGQASIAEFIIGKHRNGPRGNVKVAWLGQYASFENLATQSIQAPT